MQYCRPNLIPIANELVAVSSLTKYENLAINTVIYYGTCSPRAEILNRGS